MNTEREQDVEMGSGDGRQRWQANKQPAEQGTAGRHSRRTLRSAQASKNHTAHSWPALQQKQPLQMTSASHRAGKWGECKDVGTQEGGLRPTYCPYPQLTPLPVTVPTHSLNLWYPI